MELVYAENPLFLSLFIQDKSLEYVDCILYSLSALRLLEMDYLLVQALFEMVRLPEVVESLFYP